MPAKNSSLVRLISILLFAYLILNLLASITSMYFGFPALAESIDSSYPARYEITEESLQTSRTMLSIGAFGLLQSAIGLVAAIGVCRCLNDNKQRRWPIVFCLLSIGLASFNAITGIASGSLDIATLVIDIMLITVFCCAMKLMDGHLCKP